MPGFSDPLALLAIGFALTMLGIAIGVAMRRRAGDIAASIGPRRSVRILGPSLLFAVGMATFFALLFAGAVPLPRFLQGAFLVTAMALVFVGLFDLTAAAMGARRALRWLVIAVLSFTLPLLLSMAANNGAEALRSFDAIGVALFGSAAAILWWSLLSAPANQMAAVFD